MLDVVTVYRPWIVDSRTGCYVVCGLCYGMYNSMCDLLCVKCDVCDLHDVVYIV